VRTDGSIEESAKEQVQQLLRRSFRPEFLNRLDEIVFYKPLTKTEISSIVDLMIKDLNRRLADKQLTASLSEEAKTYVVDNGYDPVYGARPLKRFLQRKIETLIARKLISDDVAPRSALEIILTDGEPAVRVL